MFANQPALDEIWDVLDQDEMNKKVANLINEDEEDFVTFSRINRDLMERGDLFPAMMQDVRETVGMVRTTDYRFGDADYNSDVNSFYSLTPAQYRANLYRFIDRVRRADMDPGMMDQMLDLARIMTLYMTTEKAPADLLADMNDLVDFINTDLDKDDFVLLTEVMGKAMAAASYSMRLEEDTDAPSWQWEMISDPEDMASGYDTGLGNAVKGTHALLTGLRDRLDGKKYNPGSTTHLSADDRGLVYSLITDIRNTLLDPANADVVTDLVTVLEDHFTRGGSVYGNSTDTSNENVTVNMYSTQSSDLYSNTDLEVTIPELLVGQVGLLLRDDRIGALTSVDGSKSYALERFIDRLNYIRDDWSDAHLEESLYDIIRVDPYGSDRTIEGVDPNTGHEPYAISFIEDFFFLGGITNNWGWLDGGSTNEVKNGGLGSYSEPVREHGHGRPTNYITLNDSLNSIASKKTLGMGTFELALSDDSRKDHIFRSRSPFDDSNRDRFRFFYDQNYCALDFTTGATVGDLGLPASYNGGNLSGVSGDPVKNSYRPYNGNGVDEKALAAWTLGWVSRACFEGEGPYYYADPAAQTVNITDHFGNTQPYRVYYRPNKRVYAYVHYDNQGNPDHYIYPSNDTRRDPVDNETEYLVDLKKNFTVTNFAGSKQIPTTGISGVVHGYTLRIYVGDKSAVVDFPQGTFNWYTCDEIVNAIQSAFNSAGITATCTNDNRHIRIKAEGTVTLENVYKNPIDSMFGFTADDAGTEDGTTTYQVEPEFFINAKESRMRLTIDSRTHEFIIPAGELSAAEIISRMRGTTFDERYICGDSKSIVITGRAADNSQRSITLAYASGNTGDALQTLFGAVEGISSIFVNGGVYRIGNMEILPRENRYRSTWRTDYYMIRGNNNRNYTPGDLSGNAKGAGCLLFNELIKENDPKRACASHEEAIFRNYQWVMTEKKFVIVIPMWIWKNLVLIKLDSVVFQVVEGHGFAGCAPARKYRDNGVWAKANTSGTSNIQGDFRMTVLCKKISGIVDAPTIYDDTLGFGPATYSAVYHCLAPLYRFGFPRSPRFLVQDHDMNYEHFQLGSQQFVADPNDTRYEGDRNELYKRWQKRNMIFPILSSLLNVLHEDTTPERTALANFLDGLLPLFKPLFFYNRNIGDMDVCTDSLLPRITGEDPNDTQGTVPYANALMPEQFIRGYVRQDTGDPAGWFGGWVTRDYYMAKPMTTLFSALVDRKPIVQGANARFSNMDGRVEGLLPLLCGYDNYNNGPNWDESQANTRIITNLVCELLKLGDAKYNDLPSINYNDPNFDTTQYGKWGVRRRILYGLEQTMSAGKVNEPPYAKILRDRSRGTYVANGGSATKKHAIPDWMFQKRDVDIDMDRIIHRLIYGGTGPGDEGLAGWPEVANWTTDFSDDITDMADLTDDLLLPTSTYNVMDNVLDMLDTFLAYNMTDDEIAAFMYTQGKLFAWNDGGTWRWQGSDEDFDFLYTMLKNYLPIMHDIVGADGTGQNYALFMRMLQRVVKEGGLAPFLVDTVELSADTEALVDDLYSFLGEDFVTGHGAMWMTLSDLMDDLANNVESTTPEKIAEIYREYGFQQNGY